MKKMQTEAPLLFISYATPDRERVLPIVDYLISQGYDAWIDVRKLKAGQDWDREIKRALDKATIITLFVSTNSTVRRGYIQREIKIALDKYEEKIVGDIYLIPVLLDAGADLPEQIKTIQCVKAWEDDPRVTIVDAVAHQLSTIGAQVEAIQESSKVRWTRSAYKESWDGLPGYEIDLSTVNLYSTEYSNIEDISAYFRGKILALLMQEREIKFSQSTDVYNFGQERQRRTNTFDGYCADLIIVGKILTLQSAIHHYWAGAAHGNMEFLTASFILDPVVYIPSLKVIFQDEKAAFDVVCRHVRESLVTSALDGSEKNTIPRDTGWVDLGTRDWDSFSSFIFKEKGIEVLFPPYQVDCYAAGPQFGFIRYEDLVKHLRPEFAAALGIEYLVFREGSLLANPAQTEPSRSQVVAS
jgi:hypothetical protein